MGNHILVIFFKSKSLKGAQSLGSDVANQEDAHPAVEHWEATECFLTLTNMTSQKDIFSLLFLLSCHLFDNMPGAAQERILLAWASHFKKDEL